MQVPVTMHLTAGRLHLLDQRCLPHEVRYLVPNNIEELWHAIQSLAVRGAPAIGIAAAYGLALAMGPWRNNSGRQDFQSELQRCAEYLKSARPTAVNLAWACERMLRSAEQIPDDPAALLATAQALHAQDRAICRRIGDHGERLIRDGDGLLTHCNAGALAVSEWGTATAPMYTAFSLGRRFKVFANETRPLYQGARLTAWELSQAGIDVELICDNSAASLMATGEIQMAIVGTDRVTANGDVVNKIGTLSVAIACQHFGIPFYVACPSSTFDPATPRGALVPIEERDGREVLGQHAANVPVRNLAFDVTPAHLVTGIITEYGIARAPLERTLPALLAQKSA